MSLKHSWVGGETSAMGVDEKAMRRKCPNVPKSGH